MRTFLKNDILWNALGSLTYALASMVLAFVMVRLAGPKDGGIFGFGFSTLGQQFFIVAYFGIRPFHITDMRGEYRFSEYRRARILTTGLAVLLCFLYLGAMTALRHYDLYRSAVLFCLCLYKMVDGYIDVYESELQRQGRLYQTGQSLFLRTIFSVLAMILGYCGTGNLLIAAGLSVLTQILGALLFGVCPLARKKKAAVQEEAHIKQMLEPQVRAGRSEALLINTTLLFLSVFLDFYVFSASKYAVDQVMGEAVSGMYNILFMPTSFIYLLANFCIRPMLTRLSEALRRQDMAVFRGICGRMLGLSSGLAVIVLLGAALLGHWGLGIFELLLGNRYEGALQRESLTFLILVLGGGLYALCNVQYYILVTLRKQRVIFLGYLLTAVLSFLLASPLVAAGGIRAGAWLYAGMMLFLFLLFSLAVVQTLRKGAGQCMVNKEQEGMGDKV